VPQCPIAGDANAAAAVASAPNAPFNFCFHHNEIPIEHHTTELQKSEEQCGYTKNCDAQYYAINKNNQTAFRSDTWCHQGVSAHICLCFLAGKNAKLQIELLISSIFHD